MKVVKMVDILLHNKLQTNAKNLVYFVLKGTGIINLVALLSKDKI